jgi:Solute carrier family 35
MGLTKSRSKRNFVCRSPLYEVVDQLGMWGIVINGIQASIIEHIKMKTVTRSSRNNLSFCGRVGYANSC